MRQAHTSGPYVRPMRQAFAPELFRRAVWRPQVREMRDHGGMIRPVSAAHIATLSLSTSTLVCVMCTSALASGSASTLEPAGIKPFRYEPSAADPAGFPTLAQSESSTSETTAIPQSAKSPRIGAADSTDFEVIGSAASDFDGVTLGIVDAGVTWYVAEGVGFGVFAEGLYASLGDGAGDGDSWGGGGGALVRWHFVREETWTVFAEAGCGVVVSSEAIPDRGTTTNFTPRVNIGASFALSPTSDLLVRAGWFHMSNAQTGEENDGVDAASIGIGLSFAF